MRRSDVAAADGAPLHGGRVVAAMSAGLYLYCIVGTGEARNFGPIGIGGRSDAVTTIAYRDLSAVVSSVSMDRYVVGQETMLCHERVLERVMADHTLLPVRFYTVAPNAEEIRNLLRTRYAEFKRLLRELDNKVELGLKALWRDMVRVLGQVAVESGGGADGDKRLRLALDQRREATQDVVLQPLRGLASALCLGRTYGDDMIVNAAFLVDRGHEREFDARVGEMGAAFVDTIELKYVGPVPPYSFVNIVIKE